MARKTVNVDQLRVKINEMLAGSTCSPDIRRGMMNTLEFVLHETGNYHGFMYLNQAQVPEGQLPGVRYDGHEILPYPERFQITDDTRVYYYP